MQTRSVLPQLILVAGTLCALPGCFSLSLGGKTCHGDHPETKARIMSLETRVSELEQIIKPSTTEPVPVPAHPASTIKQPQGAGFYQGTSG